MSKQTEKIKALVEKRAQARLGGGQKAIEKQHARGKYTARERIEMLVDKDSFEEYDMFKLHRCHNFGMEKKQFLGDGVVAGSATIDGRLVYVYAQDFTVNGGSLSETMAQKICKVMDMAMTNGAPMICMNDSGGARIQEGISALAGYGEIFERNILASGVIPQISAILGPCAGGAVYSPALTDFIFMKEQTSYMFLTGPKVVKTVTGEDIDAEHLGGASVHASKSGVTSFTAKTEEDLMGDIRTLLTYLPSNNREEAPRVACDDPVSRKEEILNEIIPDDPNLAYDMYKVIHAITDHGDFFEVQPKFAKNIITGFARFNGQSVGIVANQPSAYAGVLDVNASRKGARFVRFCDAFNIPIVSLVDVPGFLPGTGQEYNAVIQHGAKLLFAYGEATVPKITITLRKSYGGSHIVMGCKQLRADINFAWPSSEIAVMGASGAVAILCGKEAKEVKEQGGNVAEFLAEKEEEYTEKFANPYQAAQFGYIDDVIEPRNTRFRICRALAQLAHKKQTLPAKKHGCMPM
uniref:acyl-CoA carboxylase subunit beta n=1 Tax=Prevotella sp. TaxID=59823 RepID=UPI003FEEB4A8